jgi:hypothetical protein
MIKKIKSICKEKGVPEKYAERIQKSFKIEKEDDISGAIDSFKETLLPAITESEEAAKASAKTEAEKLAIAEYEKKHNLKDGKPVETKKEEILDLSGLPPELKAFLERQQKRDEDQRKTIETLTQSLTSSQKTAANAEKTAAAKALLLQEKLPESWVNRFQLDSETKLEDQIKGLKEKYTTIQQKAIDDAVARGDYAPGGMQFAERTEKQWEEVMNGGSEAKTVGVVDLGIK